MNSVQESDGSCVWYDSFWCGEVTSLEEMSKKYYAVRLGRNPGVYDSWEDCKQQVLGFDGNEYKSFSTKTEAQSFLKVSQTSIKAAKRKVKRNSDKRTVIPTSSPDLSKSEVGAYSEQAERTASAALKKMETVSATMLCGVEQVDELAGGQPIILRAEKERKAEVKQSKALSSQKGLYTIQYDGASKGNPGRAGAGAVLHDPEGKLVCKVSEGLGTATNNIAEYRGLILGLREALRRGIRQIQAQGDSTLVCQQVLGKWKVNSAHLQQLCDEVKLLTREFEKFSIKQVDREFNKFADRMANEGVHLPAKKWRSFIDEREELAPPASTSRPAISTKKVAALVDNTLQSSPLTNLLSQTSDNQYVLQMLYTLEFDGCSTGKPAAAGAGAVLRHPQGTLVCELIESLGQITSNAAEYHGLLIGLREAQNRGISHLQAKGDSTLVCEQLLGSRGVSYHHVKLYEEAKTLIQKFAAFSIQRVDSSLNTRAAALAKKAIAIQQLSRAKVATRKAQENSPASLVGNFPTNIQNHTSRDIWTSGVTRSFSTAQLQAACDSCRRSMLFHRDLPNSSAFFHNRAAAESPLYDQTTAVCGGRAAAVQLTKPGIAHRPWIAAAKCLRQIVMFSIFV